MFVRILGIIAPVFLCVLVGHIWTRTGRPFETRFVTRLIMNVGAPFLILSAFNRSQLQKDALAEIGIAVVTVSAIVAVLTLAVLRIFRADIRTYFGSLVFWNSGNMGLPICLFAYGDVGMSLAIVVFMWVMMLNFTLGVTIVNNENNIVRLLRMPFIYAIIIALALSISGNDLPSWLADTADILGGLTIPLMLLSLGASLSALNVTMLPRSIGFAILRFAIGFGAGVLVTELFGLTGPARGVIILQATMPSAVFNYLIAARYERDAAAVAGVVVATTVMSFVVLPFALWFVLK